MPRKPSFEPVDTTIWLRLFYEEYEAEYNNCLRRGISESELVKELKRSYRPESQFITQVYNDQYGR